MPVWGLGGWGSLRLHSVPKAGNVSEVWALGRSEKLRLARKIDVAKVTMQAVMCRECCGLSN